MSYFGLCIGGPLDGHFRSWNTPSFKTPTDQPRQDFPEVPTTSCSKPQTFSVTSYSHSPWRVPGSDRSFDLWLHEGLALPEALAQLQACYHGGRRLP